MASRRKSSTPCMLPPRGEGEWAAAAEDADGSRDDDDAEEASELSDSEAVSARPSGQGDVASGEPAGVQDAGRKGIALSKTPIMRCWPEPKKFTASRQSQEVIKVESDDEMDHYQDPPVLSPAAPMAAARLVPVSAPLHIQTGTPSFLVNGTGVLNIKGGALLTGTLPTGVLQAGALAQVLSALQKQNQTQLLIPVSSIPAYDAAMDSNILLLAAYNRFPYPSPSETETLAAQTNFSEENVKLWFSAQRLKDGISWTPEEVEEARRKKSNGTVRTLHQSLPQTLAVIPVAADGQPSIFQTCQIVGQPGLVLAQVGGASALPALPPPPLAPTAPAVPGERAAEGAEPPHRGASSRASSASKPKKSKEQLAELKASYGRRRVATEAEISRLMRVTGLSKRAIKKWFSDTRYNQRNSKEPRRESAEATGDDGGEESTEAADKEPPLPSALPPERRGKLRHAFPDFTPQRFKEKTSGQLLVLESSFQKSRTPSDDELTRLREQTKLTRREVDAWFSDRRKGGLAETGAPTSARRALKKSPAQLDVLRKAFVRSRRPTAREYDRMAEDSGLPRGYIVNWFGETRYAVKNGNLKWFDVYRAGKEESASPDEAARMPKKSKKRFRGWSRRSRRPSAVKRDADEAQSGEALLQAFLVQQQDPSQEHLDDLAAKTGMSVQEVRDWLLRHGDRPFSHQDQEEEDEGDAEEATGHQRDEDTIQESSSPGGSQT
ncbi:zinc fingers and homeoboxes protein 1-like isoform X2 [Stigmatopora nigra]